jgi:hypothetical protein
MSVLNEGYHLIAAENATLTVTITFEGSVKTGNGFMCYLIDGEYRPLMGGKVTTGATYTLRQRLLYPLYLQVIGVIDVVSQISFKKSDQLPTNLVALMPHKIVKRPEVFPSIKDIRSSPHNVFRNKAGVAIFDQISCNQGPFILISSVTHPILHSLLQVAGVAYIPDIPAVDPDCPFRIVADLTGLSK